MEQHLEMLSQSRGTTKLKELLLQQGPMPRLNILCSSGMERMDITLVTSAKIQGFPTSQQKK